MTEQTRRWKAWAILEPDETLHSISMEGPDQSESIRGLIDMGWFAVPVDVMERRADGEKDQSR